MIDNDQFAALNRNLKPLVDEDMRYVFGLREDQDPQEALSAYHEAVVSERAARRRP